jgi:beta-1,4-mannosyl-glycoprotein beta-1,4-N-acetylglucosaminyltransferase
MIIDCFTFWKELDILEIRLNELYDTVDKFVLVEASRTQSMLPKPYYFEENKSRFEKFLDKIIHVKVDDELDVSKNPWVFDIHQRMCIKRGLSTIENLSDEDFILVSDVDEIPKSSALKEYLPQIDEVICFGMTYNVYYLNLVMRNHVWPGTVATKWKYAKNIDMHTLIKVRDRLPANLIIKNSGWHLGYQGGEQIVFDKYFSCTEPFNKKDIPSRELFSQVFKERARDGGSFIFCDNLSRQDLFLDKKPIDELPKFILDNKEKYSKLLI